MVDASVLFGFYTRGEMLAASDFNTLGLLLGMMMLVAMLGKTGLFEYLAIPAVQRSGGNPWRLSMFLGGLTAVLSNIGGTAKLVSCAVGTLAFLLIFGLIRR